MMLNLLFVHPSNCWQQYCSELQKLKIAQLKRTAQGVANKAAAKTVADNFKIPRENYTMITDCYMQTADIFFPLCQPRCKRQPSPL